MNKAFRVIKATASTQTTKAIYLAMWSAEEQRTNAIYRHDVEETQALNMVIAAWTEILTERLPELDTAIDRWCDEMSDDRTMAQFIVDWFLLNEDVV